MAEAATEKAQEPEEVEEWTIKRPPRAKLSPEAVRKRMEDFPKRREAFIAAVRGGGPVGRIERSGGEVEENVKGMSSLTIDLTPEMDHQLQERAHQQGVAVADLVRSALETLIEPQASVGEEEASAGADRPIWEKLAAIANEVPVEEVAGQPTDLAEQHDHYIYGTPKKP